MLTKKGKYGLKALAHLALLAPGESAFVAEIAAKNNISKKFLDGILRSKKGPGGGYSLAKPASEINIGQAIRVLDGPLAPIRCASRTAYEPCEDCEDHNACQVRRSMLLVREAIVGVLDAMTLEQFARNGGLEDDGTAPEWAQLTA
jgi:Rrf2 family protein